MIRLAQASDHDDILFLWLKSTTLAHPFIDEMYWIESAVMVRKNFLPQADTWISYEVGSRKVNGFASVLDQQFLGAMFVSENVYGCGVAQALMQQVKMNFPLLMLEVYQQNLRAMAFYRKEGFIIVNDTRHPGTGLPTWIMSWQHPL